MFTLSAIGRLVNFEKSSNAVNQSRPLCVLLSGGHEASVSDAIRKRQSHSEIKVMNLQRSSVIRDQNGIQGSANGWANQGSLPLRT